MPETVWKALHVLTGLIWERYLTDWEAVMMETQYLTLSLRKSKWQRREASQGLEVHVFIHSTKTAFYSLKSIKTNKKEKSPNHQIRKEAWSTSIRNSWLWNEANDKQHSLAQNPALSFPETLVAGPQKSENSHINSQIQRKGNWVGFTIQSPSDQRTLGKG